MAISSLLVQSQYGRDPTYQAPLHTALCQAAVWSL